jgi:hypothetical protein
MATLYWPIRVVLWPRLVGEVRKGGAACGVGWAKEELNLGDLDFC